MSEGDRLKKASNGEFLTRETMPKKAIKSKSASSRVSGRKSAKSKNPIQRMAKNVKAPQKLKAVGRKARGIEPDTIAKGAAAVSIAAGMIAAGAALMDKENRRKMGKMAGKGMEFMQDMASDMSKEAQNKYQAVQLAVPLKKKTSRQKRGRSKKS